ncbi:MAG: carbohydrate ABC transporter permease [Clostridia bacterium]|nr:carbohydrate ABC transporter permease [Clostridia bacterium]
MKRKLEISEVIFKIISYTFLTIFALCCLYPFVYALSASLSSYQAVEYNKVILFPVDLQIDAYKFVLSGSNGNGFWNSYTNTIFVTFYGTIWALGVAILGGYALSKKRLLFRKGFNFFLVFTMWFSAGLVPQYRNYLATQDVFNAIGITDDKWLIVIAMGMAAMNIILLRNAFEGVPSEIEEAARVDGATEFQILTKVYIPMSKSTIATVALFFAISRWNGYYWAKTMLGGNSAEWPLQVYLRTQLEYFQDPDYVTSWNNSYPNISSNSVIFVLIVCAIIPILIIYPFIQKYFAKGVNMGGVKE